MADGKQSSREPLANRIKDAIPLQNHWETFLDWLLEKTELFSQKYRYTLTARLINRALDIQEKIIQARFGSDKLELLRILNVDMEIIACLLRRCYNKKLLSASAYEYASRQLEEAGKMVTGWRKYQESKKQKAIQANEEQSEEKAKNEMEETNDESTEI